MIVSQETLTAQVNKYLAEKADLSSQIEELKANANSAEDTLVDLATLKHDLENTAFFLQDSLVGHHLPESCQCTLCGKALTLPYVYWFGATPVAYHLRCLEHLLPSLQRDIDEFYWGRRRANEVYAEKKKIRRVAPGIRLPTGTDGLS